MRTALISRHSWIIICLTLIMLFMMFPENSLSQNKFKIVFTALPGSNAIKSQITNEFLDSVKSWGGTGVSLLVLWWPYQSSENVSSINFDLVDRDIDRIISKSLDVYIRIVLGQRPRWTIDSSSAADWHTNSRGLPSMFRYNPNGAPEAQLNFTSSRSKKMMLTFYRKLLEHIHSRYFGKPSYSRIIDITPSVSHDAEMEFPYDEMCGYSDTEISSFHKYLEQKYSPNTNSRLNLKWGFFFYSI